jgi:phage terminase small subunit
LTLGAKREVQRERRLPAVYVDLTRRSIMNLELRKKNLGIDSWPVNSVSADLNSALTPKQERFVLEYLKDLNGKQAAIRAGYSPKTAEVQASRLLSNVKVSEFVKAQMDERAEEIKLDAQYVLKNLQKVAERCMQAVPVLEKVDGEWVETGEFKFDSSGANRALELIGKHLKMFTDVVEVNDYSDLTEEQLKERIKQLQCKLGL